MIYVSMCISCVCILYIYIYTYRYTQSKRSTFCSTWARVVMMTMLIIQRWQMNCSKVVWWHKTWWKPPSIILRPPPRSWPSQGVAFRSTWDPPPAQGLVCTDIRDGQRSGELTGLPWGHQNSHLSPAALPHAWSCALGFLRFPLVSWAICAVAISQRQWKKPWYSLRCWQSPSLVWDRLDFGGKGIPVCWGLLSANRPIAAWTRRVQLLFGL